MSQLNLKMAHRAGSITKAIDVLPRLHLKFTEIFRLKTRADVKATTVPATTSSSDVVNKELVFFNRTHHDEENQNQANKAENRRGEVQQNG